MLKHNANQVRIICETKVLFDTHHGNLMVWIAKPQSDGLQTVKKYALNYRPKSEYIDGQQNQILFFEFRNVSEVNLKIDISATLWQSKRPSLELVKTVDDDVAHLRQYLKDEQFLEQTDEVKKKVTEITQGCEKIVEKLRLIFEFVKKNFKYEYPVKSRGVRNLDFNNLRGDCGEYSALLVTMCRIAGIPAMNRTGYVIFPENNQVQEHGWVSVFLSPFGWIDLDAQFASQEVDKNAYFLERNDYRIALVNGFNMPLQPPIPKNYLVDYWLKNGLPVNYDFVQVLQPLVFASQSNVSVVEKVYFKNPLI